MPMLIVKRVIATVLFDGRTLSIIDDGQVIGKNGKVVKDITAKVNYGMGGSGGYGWNVYLYKGGEEIASFVVTE